MTSVESARASTYDLLRYIRLNDDDDDDDDAVADDNDDNDDDDDDDVRYDPREASPQLKKVHWPELVAVHIQIEKSVVSMWLSLKVFHNLCYQATEDFEA